MIGRIAIFAMVLAWAPGVARADWYEARSTHFVVYSQGAPDKLKTYIEGLERYDSAMRQLYGVPDLGDTSSDRVTIFVVPSQGQVAKLYGKGGSDVAGFYDARASGAIAFASTSNNGPSDQYALGAQAVLFHEYAHHFMFTAWANAPFPAWLVEGFAEFNATATIEKNGDVEIGAPPLYRVFGIFSGAMPMKSLVSTGSIAKLDENRTQALYGRGWLLVHYLTLDRARAPMLGAYLKAIADGTASPVAAKAAFGDLNKLDGALDRYASGRLQAYRIPASMLKVGAVAIRPLTAGEVAVMPALLRSKRGVDEKTAPDVVALAEKLAAPFPADAGAQNELAEAEFDAGHLEASDAAAARALAADPKSLHAMIYRGMAQMAMAARDKIDDPARWTAVRGWFTRANRLDTENAEPLQLYYASFMDAHQPPSHNAQDGLLYAQVLAPFDNGLRLTAANVLLHEDKPAEARTMLSTLAYDPHGGALAQFAATIIDAIDKGGAKQALATMEAGPPDPGKDGDKKG